MTHRIDTLTSVLSKIAAVIEAIPADRADAATPCSDYRVADLLDHLAVWVQVFDAAVNDAPQPFDPNDPATTAGMRGQAAELFEAAAAGIVSGLTTKGFDRPMTLTSTPLPGEFVLDMMIMEYVGHGWDLAVATGQSVPFTEDEAAAALLASASILQPQYRGTGMFDAEVEVPPSASSIDRYIGFIGRDPHWSAAG